MVEIPHSLYQKRVQLSRYMYLLGLGVIPDVNNHVSLELYFHCYSKYIYRFFDSLHRKYTIHNNRKTYFSDKHYQYKIDNEVPESFLILV